jgi:hypothetical protein
MGQLKRGLSNRVGFLTAELLQLPPASAVAYGMSDGSPFDRRLLRP